TSTIRFSRDRVAKGSAVPARLTRYEAWMEMGAIPSRAVYSMKAGASAGGSGRRRQAVGLSLKIWSARAPICRARRAAGRRPRPGARGAPVPVMEPPTNERNGDHGPGDPMRELDGPGDEPAPPESRMDLATVGLLVFFVSLILIVAALLILPAVF